uniref:Uncharacterized protein n=1 Tax=Ixodes ricinus TaxID=34613 RepID=A0A6B0UMM8_IXORI
MYCSISISVFIFLPSLKCIPVFVFPNTFCLYLKCISDTYRDTFVQMYFSISILATISMYPSICISKYIFEYFCPTLLRNLAAPYFLGYKTQYFSTKLHKQAFFFFFLVCAGRRLQPHL